ncbi:MAG: hypothetical protein WC936_01285 [Candidatus Nanoarchaeia archaeon]|jgi:hypothetical protein
MINYIKNLAYNCPDANFLEKIFLRYEINKITETKTNFKAETFEQYFNNMPDNGLSISVSSAELKHFFKELGVYNKNKIWVYYPSLDDFSQSKLKDEVIYEEWRDKISENVLLHELIELFSPNQNHNSFKEKHEIKTIYPIINCTSNSNSSFSSLFVEDLDAAYSKTICPFCERKIIIGLRNHA